MKALPTVGEILAQWQPGYPGYQGPWGWHYNMMGGGWGIFMFIFMVIFLALIIGAVVLLVRYLSPHSRTKAASSEDALEILRRRYARGEIQKAEFEEKRKDLES
jgi:putative membrane protein